MRDSNCPTCSAPMAGDQRYCLSCGERRADARLDFLEILRGPEAAAAGATAATAPGHDARAWSNVGVIAGIGCLLLAMGVGVIIGRSHDSGSSSGNAPAQVIRVQGTGAAAPAAAAGAAKKAKATKTKASKDAGSSAVSGHSKASNPELKRLSKLSPEQYQKQSQKLPKTVGTGGKPPPKDNKTPAGGGNFQSFG